MTEINDNCDQNIDDFNHQSEVISNEDLNNSIDESCGQLISESNERLIEESNEETNDSVDESSVQLISESNKRSAEESNEEIDGSESQSNDNKSNKKLKKVIKESEILKSNKRGIVYLSYIPLGLNVQKIRQLLSEFGEIDRIYLEKDKQINESVKKKKRDLKKKSYNCRYVEGWVEFKKKRVAKTVAQVLNGKQIGGKRKNKFYDQIWSIKYLHKFKWTHLAEQLNYEKALRQQRLRLEIGRAKKEATFYEQMTNKYKYNKSKKSENSDQTNQNRTYKQRVTDEAIRQNKSTDNDIDFELLSKIFK